MPEDNQDSVPVRSQTSAPAPSVEQEPSTPAQPAAAPAPGPKKNSKKKFIIGGIIAAAIVLLGGGTALGYALWYQNPEKVVVDGVSNVFSKAPGTSKLTASYKSGDAGVTLTVDSRSSGDAAQADLKLAYKAAAQNIDLTGSAEIITKTDTATMYLKVKDVRKLVAAAVDAMIESTAKQYQTMGMKLSQSQIDAQKKSAMAQYEPIIAKVDNKWIKFTADGNDSTSKDQKCLTDAYKKLQSDSASQNEMKQAYTDNKFIIIKEELGLKDGSYGYVLDLDQDKLKSFSKALESTVFVKSIEDCTGRDMSTNSNSSSTSKDNPFKDTRVEMWVSQWSHQITRVSVTTTHDEPTSTGQNATLNLGVDMSYEEVAPITEPTDAVDSKTLMDDLMKSMGGAPASSSTMAM